MFSTDQQLDISKLSPIGQHLVRARDTLIKEWEGRMRAELKGAKRLKRPILVNTLPAYIDNLAQALTPNHPRTLASDFSTIAQEHGGERARLTFYDPDELIREYQLLKEVVFGCLEQHPELSREDRLIIHHSIDLALRESATTFALVQADIREQFIATLTHDLRSPIGIIKMAAELASEEAESKPEVMSLLAKIIDNSKRADRMIQDLLDTTIVRSGDRLQLELGECNLLDITRGVTSGLALAQGDRFRILGESVKGIWSADALRRALENLCTNAIKYGDTNSPVTIHIAKSNGRAIVSVHNEGPAIPADEQEDIFQVFRRAHAAKKGKKKGWGLGLALVRGVAESHGGSLTVESVEGRGTTFTVDIPLDARPFQDAPVTQ